MVDVRIFQIKSVLCALSLGCSLNHRFELSALKFLWQNLQGNSLGFLWGLSVLMWNQTEVRKEAELLFNVLQDLAELNTKLVAIQMQNNKTIMISFHQKCIVVLRTFTFLRYCCPLAKSDLSIFCLFIKSFADMEFPEPARMKEYHTMRQVDALKVN